MLAQDRDELDNASNPDGWGNNFNILTADFDPQSMLGDFDEIEAAGFSLPAAPSNL